MAIVTLVSGGLDSSLMAVLANENGNKQFPLFINYGQLGFEQEWKACQTIHKTFNLPKPHMMNISGYGETILSGLTSPSKHVKNEAFLAGRNLVFLTMGAAYAYQNGADAVSLGFLKEETAIFNDQTDEFLIKAQDTIRFAMGFDIKILTPLRSFYKQDVVALAKEKKIFDTYSCHSGSKMPCGKCIACEEYNF
ncbi:7-cyano-7-deazaguanine synthase [Aliarcobacter butzleri]|uniref:7-cyano-7-deazaguanine synthase n=1 Tax=Aliarcobacter butzleri TaxID=28197 RepID=UPI001EE0D331|nr:7-cyano-7-deazaguanine synthase [Aliarcobacter butzleri]MCG3697563.1 7-cyano-7-deazaguanine synthase [Aliarcobacter butzleri]